MNVPGPGSKWTKLIYQTPLLTPAQWIRMLFSKIISEGLAHNSYIVGLGGKAAVVDPRRDCDIYLELAGAHDMKIAFIFETHRNEDYAIGSCELADLTDSEILHGSRLDFKYGTPVMDGDKFVIGGLEIEVIETPGHTDESISLVLRDKTVSDNPYMVFTGDALFAGDVGRTDLLGVGRRCQTSEALYDSIFEKILPLGDGVIVCPAHGAGSVCGMDISDHELTTIGYEKETNSLLKMDRAAFSDFKTREHHYIPPYFRKMEELNHSGSPLIHRVPSLTPFRNHEVNLLKKEQAQLLDIRAPTSYGAGHIPGSICIWREGLASFIGWFLNYEDPIILVDDFNLEMDPVIRQFVRMGYDNLAGYLAGGFPAWFKGAEEIRQIESLSVQQLHERLRTSSPYLLDVRDINNWNEVGHIPGAHQCYIGELSGHMSDIPVDKDAPVIVYCDAGYKGCLGASILKNAGYSNVANLLGGMTAWVNAGYPVEK